MSLSLSQHNSPSLSCRSSRGESISAQDLALGSTLCAPATQQKQQRRWPHTVGQTRRTTHTHSRVQHSSWKEKKRVRFLLLSIFSSFLTSSDICYPIPSFLCCILCTYRSVHATCKYSIDQHPIDNPNYMCTCTTPVDLIEP